MPTLQLFLEMSNEGGNIIHKNVNISSFSLVIKL
ncbi:MAG: hypothetical protein RLZZ338_4475 [Cyanobacteriota bacterium]